MHNLCGEPVLVLSLRVPHPCFIPGLAPFRHFIFFYFCLRTRRGLDAGRTHQVVRKSEKGSPSITSWDPANLFPRDPYRKKVVELFFLSLCPHFCSLNLILRIKTLQLIASLKKPMQFRLWVSPYVINPKNLVSTENSRVLNPGASTGKKESSLIFFLLFFVFKKKNHVVRCIESCHF